MTSQYTASPTPATAVRRPTAAPAGEGLPGAPQPAFFSVLWRHKVLLVAGALVGALLGLISALLQPTAYISESRVFFASQSSFDPLGSAPFGADPVRYLEQQAALITSTPVLTQAVELDESIGELTALRESLSVAVSSDADIVTIKAAADTGAGAEARVAAVVEAYRDFQEAAVEDRTEAASDLSTSGERRQIEQRAALYGDGVALVEPPTSQETSSLVRNTTIGGLVGLLLALAWAFGRQKPIRARARTKPPTAGRGGPAQASPADGWDWEAARRE